MDAKTHMATYTISSINKYLLTSSCCVVLKIKINFISIKLASLLTLVY